MTRSQALSYARTLYPHSEVFAERVRCWLLDGAGKDGKRRCSEVGAHGRDCPGGRIAYRIGREHVFHVIEMSGTSWRDVVAKAIGRHLQDCERYGWEPRVVRP